MIDDTASATTVPASASAPASARETMDERRLRALGADPDLPSPLSEEAHDDGMPPPSPPPPL